MRPSCPLRTSFRVVHRDHRSSTTCFENAALSARVAAAAPDPHTYDRFKRLERGWRALAETRDWLDGAAPPVERTRAVMGDNKRET